MSKLADLDMLNVKHGTYRTGTTAALRDPNLLPIAKMRRRQLSQMMVALDHEQSKTKVPPGPYLIQQKLDGEFTVAVYRDGDVVSLNPYGTARAGAPWHAEFGQLLKKAGVKSAIFGGELYVKFKDGKRCRVMDVCRIARAPETQADVDSLQYAVFSIYDLDGVDLSMSPAAQSAKIHEIFKGGHRVHPMPTVEGNEAEVQKRFDAWVLKDGGEGLVIRSDTFGWFKIKPRHTLDVAVVGFSEGTEDRAGMLHSLLLAIVRADGRFHVVGRTGGGFSDADRVQLLAQLKARVVESSYIEVNSDRVAYQMITPGLTAEISCLDVISETSDGSPIERMVISYDPAGTRWSSLRRLPLASLISPQFERLRDDKQATSEDVGLHQLTRIVELPENAESTVAAKLPPSQILKRAVATKELKGKTMVRKLLMWQTNKDAVSAEYPAYVLLATDFSPNRKTPLEREIRVSADLAQIEGYWKTWAEENFVNGWAVR
jgi:ATP-dependent DNA ligase